MRAKKIIYNIYGALQGTFMGRREYCPKDKADYDRVMKIFEQDPDCYEIVNVVYEEGDWD